MPWSVAVKNDGTPLTDDERRTLTHGIDYDFWDVYCKRIRKGHFKANYNVYLRHGKESMLLGETNLVERVGSAWLAYGWAQGEFYSVRGMATRRYAIIYMLDQHGFGDNW